MRILYLNYMGEKNNNTDNHQIIGMDANSSFAGHAEPPAFRAVLTPYRSLSRTGFMVLMAFVIVSCVSTGIVFMIAGAWPVMIALFLDVLLVFVAFKLNYRSARRSEEIAIWRDEVIVRKISPTGKTTEFSFNPFWTKFLVDRHEEFGVLKMKLRQAGKELELGSFLNPDDRKNFASAFSIALADVRR